MRPRPHESPPGTASIPEIAGSRETRLGVFLQRWVWRGKSHTATAITDVCDALALDFPVRMLGTGSFFGGPVTRLTDRLGLS